MKTHSTKTHSTIAWTKARGDTSSSSWGETGTDVLTSVSRAWRYNLPDAVDGDIVLRKHGFHELPELLQPSVPYFDLSRGPTYTYSTL